MSSDEEIDFARQRALFARRVFDKGRGDIRAAMTALSGAFPGLEGAAGVEHWNPRELAEWSGPKSHGERCAAQFVLSVWNPDEAKRDAFECGYFDVHEAMQVWDKRHRAAFLEWASDPWWA